jgi:predicted PurR-regulated permease PerM
MRRGEMEGRPEWPARQAPTIGFVAKATLVVLGLWALANMLWLGRELLFVAFLAMLVALFLSIFVEPLTRLGLPRALAAILVVAAFAALFLGLCMLAWPTLSAQFVVIRREIPGALNEIETWFRGQYEAVTGQVGRPTPELAEQLRLRLGREAVNLVAGALPLLNTVVGALFGVFVVVFAGLYLVIEPDLYVRGVTRLVPPDGRERFGKALAAAGYDLRRWIFGTAINMILIGVFTTLGLWILGIPAALALGLIAAALEFIPIFGPILSAVPAVAVALIISPADAVWVVLLYIVIQQVEANVVTPLVMRGAVELPPALTLLVGTLMAILFGFLGLLLAVPILAAVLSLVRHLYVEEIENGAIR